MADLAKNGELKRLSAELAEKTSAPFNMIEHLLRTIHYGGTLVVCRAADLSWETVEVILVHRHPDHPIAAMDLEQAKADSAALTKPTAVRLLGYWQAQECSRGAPN